MLLALIREAECIGCSKCIPACPVDAIVGTNKFLHYVLEAECIGCKLCIDPCPVDCIELVPAKVEIDKPARAAKAKQRYLARQRRLAREAQYQLPVYANAEERSNKIKLEISAALSRDQRKNATTPHQ